MKILKNVLQYKFINSITGNIYGVYDMSSGAHKYVMGNYNKTAIVTIPVLT